MKLNLLLIPALAGTFILGIVTGRITTPELYLDESNKGANEFAKGIKPSRNESSVSTYRRESLFEAIPIQSLEQMARTAATSSDTVENESMLSVLVSEWAKKDPHGATEFAQELKRSDLVYQGCLEWSQQNPDEVLRWIKQNEDNAGQQRYLTMAVYKGMAKTDPLGAVGRVEQMPAGAQRDELMTITIDEWAKQDVHEVFNWLETTEITPQFSDIYGQVMGRYIEQDPVSAATLISAMQSCDQKVNFASQVAVQLAEQNVEHALEWVKTLDEGNAKKYALQGLVDRWSNGDEAGAALDYVMADDNNQQFKDLFTTVALNLSHRNPELLIKTFDQMDEAQQIIAAQQLASAYSIDNPDRNIEWIQSLTPGIVKDTAIKNTLKSYKNTNVSQAFKLSEIISDRSLRAEEIQAILLVWLPMDQQAAEQALHASPAIAALEKETLLDRLYKKLKPSDYVLPEKP